MIRRVAVAALGRSGLAGLLRRLLVRRGRFVLELHGVASRRYPELPADVQPSFCRDELAALLAWLRPRFPFLTPEELLESDAPGVLLTFDDGTANLHDNAVPMLAEAGIPAVFFVTTRHVADPGDWLPAARRAAASLGGELSPALRRDLFDGLSADELRQAASRGVTVGSHTVGHPFLTTLDDEALEREVAQSKRFLEEVTGRPVELFAYPSGDYDERVARAVRRAGYRAAFVEGSRRLGLGLFEIPRIGLYSADPAYLGVKLCGLHRRPLGALGDA